MNELDDPAVVERHLRTWLAGPPFGPGGLVACRRLPGHAGTTYAVGVSTDDGPPDLVIKLAPPGARRSGNTDVLRQAEVLRLVRRVGIRVPAVLATGGVADGPFGVPFVVTELVPGAPPGDAFDPEDAPGARGADLFAAFGEAIDELARLHAVPVTDAVVDVLGERTLADEIRFWDAPLAKADEPAWVTMGRDLGRRLLASMPDDTPTGIVHGDYYSNNWLFDGDRLSAVVDWENTIVGPRLVDIGWVCMMYDAASWGPMRQPTLEHTPSPTWLADRYARHLPAGVAVQMGWFRAHAGYRLACLTAYYLRLHRSGRRPDAIWEVFGDAFEPMLARAHHLLDDIS